MIFPFFKVSCHSSDISGAPVTRRVLYSSIEKSGTSSYGSKTSGGNME